MDLIDTIEGPIAFRKGLDALSNIALNLQASSPEAFLDVFGPDDLLNATIVLNAVLFPLTFRHHGLATEAVAHELGKSIRQTVILATGIDLHQAAASVSPGDSKAVEE